MKNSLLTKSARRARMQIALLLAALVLVFLLSFSLGRYDVPVGQVVKILISSVFPIEASWTKNMEIAVLNVRLPRILLVCMVGCCLAMAGASYQSVFQNPMAAPDILGASSGACFGAALAILLDGSRAMIMVSAFSFSLLTVALVYLIGNRTRGSRTVNILLAGVMISSLFSAGTSYIKLVADPSNQLPAITYWLMGSFSGARMRDVRFAFIPMALGCAPLLLVRWRLNILSAGEDEARAMGVNTPRLRLLTVICATLMTAASVAVSGMIGWVGLVIPHLCRKTIGNDCRHLLPASMVFGALFLLLVDNVSRNLLATEIPIGILTAFVGDLPDDQKGYGAVKLEIKNLSFAYRDHPVLQDINFDTRPGEFLSVLGPNGVGKSTLFRCILGILRDYQGEILLDGREARGIAQREMASMIAYIPQSHRPTFGYTVQDTVLMGVTHRLSPFAAPRAEHVRQAREAMARVGVQDMADRSFAHLSGGEQQLVLVARALCQQSRILVMDEPTSSLDFGNQLRVLACVRGLTQEGYTVLLSTHNPQHALTFSHRILALHDGGVAALGDAEDTLTPELIWQLYQVEVDFVDTQQGRVIVPHRGGSL